MNGESMQSTNFEFLRPKWPALADLGGYAEMYAQNDPASARVKSRLLAENLALLTCQHLRLPIADDNFLSMLKELEGTRLLPKAVLDTFHLVRIEGNRAAHRLNANDEHALNIVRSTFDLARWWMGFHAASLDNLPANFLPIKDFSRPNSQHEWEQLEQLKKLTAELVSENERLRQQQNQLDDEVLQDFQVKAARTADTLRFNEAETRKRLIDSMLLMAGWDINDPDQVQVEVSLSGQYTATGQGRADYVLYDDDGTALAVIEAKRTVENPAIGRKQAQGYADDLERNDKRSIRPLIILSNGYENILVDDCGGPKSLGIRGYADRQLYGFPSKDSMSYRVKYQRQAMQDPLQVPHRPDIANRPYQVEAIKAVAECFGEKRRQKALIVQATGTGKTRVAIALADLLIRAEFAKRVLFLCDRRELRRQAKNAFTQFMPDRNVAMLSRNKETDAQIVLATYPAMMKQFQKYDVAWFDLIIADESHRSIYNKYRDLFLYFDARQIGLTATPRHKVSHNTYQMFECQEGNPTYYYEYERAVDDGYLVDFTPITVSTKFLREGIHSDNLSDAEKQRLEEEGIDPESLDIDAERLDKQAYNKDTNRKILQNLMENGLRDAAENGPGKSIIFARNHTHAELLGKLFQEMYPEYGPDYCAVIDNYNPRAEQLIDDFKTWTKYPVIAISVDMLDTGIDIPEILNLVFAKPVKSYVKFWQMIGRGTRLCPNLLGPEQDKKRFYLFDHWGNCEYFDSDHAYQEAAHSQALLERLFAARLTLAETALAKYDKDSFDRVLPLIRAMLKALPDDSLPVQEKHRHKLSVLSGSTLEQFAPATVDLLRRGLEPLMRYVNIRGEREAYDFDLLITELQTELLLESVRVEGIKSRLDNALAGLRTNIAAVKNKFEAIRALREKTFWEQDQATVQIELEAKRKELRGIMQYSLDSGSPFGIPPLLLDIADSDVHFAVREKVRPSSEEMQAYRQRVRDVLEPHFNTNPTLRKLRRGEGLNDRDFDALTSLTLTQSNDVKLEWLREFYPNTTRLEKELRSIVGLDAEVVKERFAIFFHKHQGLTSLQIAFLNLLQKHIQAYGPVRLENLYEAPFTHMNAEGPDGIFTDETQLRDLIQVLQSFDDSAAPAATPGL